MVCIMALQISSYNNELPNTKNTGVFGCNIASNTALKRIRLLHTSKTQNGYERKQDVCYKLKMQ